MGILPDFSSLPPWGQVVAYGIFTLSVGMTIIAARLGIQLGRKKQGDAKSSEDQAQVAAVIVDPTALNMLSAAGEAINFSLTQANSILRGKVKTDISLTRQTTELVIALKELTHTQTEVSRLLKEYIEDHRQEREEEERAERDREQRQLGYQQALDEIDRKKRKPTT